MNNYERIKGLTIEKMAEEIKLIANWDRREVSKANKVEDFYIDYLKTEALDTRCNMIDFDYCKNDCPFNEGADI